MCEDGRTDGRRLRIYTLFINVNSVFTQKGSVSYNMYTPNVFFDHMKYTMIMHLLCGSLKVCRPTSLSVLRVFCIRSSRGIATISRFRLQNSCGVAELKGFNI